MKEYFNFALQSIRHRQLRSWLTIIGVVIGIAAIVALVSVSQGLENAIEEQFKNLGSNKIYIVPQSVGLIQVLDSDLLTEDDVDTIDSLAEVESINSYLYEKTDVFFGKEDQFIGVSGLESDVDPKEVFEGQGIELEDGRWANKGERGVIVIGNQVAHDLYDKEVVVNSKLEIDDEKYKVVGIMNPLGNEEDDTNTFLHMDDARSIHDTEIGLTFIEVVFQDDINVAAAADKVQKALERDRDNDNFEIFIPEQILEQLGNILNIFQVILGGIAGISLIVGGIGIMNSMFTNVLERKKEIGILKAVGAGPSDIRNIFIVEAGLIGLGGGLIGVVVGQLIAFSIGELALAAGFLYLDIQVEWPIIIFGVAFAFVVGMVSGYLPARDAAKLLPVEALRE